MVEFEVLVEAVQKGNQKFMRVLLLVACHVIQLAPHCIQEMRGYERVPTPRSVDKEYMLLY